VVEDEAAILRFLHTILEAEEFEVRIVESGVKWGLEFILPRF
jgi:DNA-binding response OmpR family regulator